MIVAEVLKIRRRLGLMVVSLLLTVGSMVITFTVLASLHAANPLAHTPAGGLGHFTGSFRALSFFSFVAAVLIGSTAGSGDVSAGVFRMTVPTGRSRVILFAVRLPAGLIVLFPMVAAGYTLACIVTVAAAGGQPVPGNSLMAQMGLWLLLEAGMQFVLSLGVASATGSSTTTIPLVLAFNIILTPLIEHLSGFEWFRQVFLGVALDQLAPGKIAFGERMLAHMTMSPAAAWTVVVAWGVAMLALGGWRTIRRDA